MIKVHFRIETDGTVKPYRRYAQGTLEAHTKDEMKEAMYALHSQMKSPVQVFFHEAKITESFDDLEELGLLMWSNGKPVPNFFPKKKEDVKFTCLVRTARDGYLYKGSDNKLYFCDHSGDTKQHIARPDTCEDPADPLDVHSVMDPVKAESADVYAVKTEDNKTVLLTYTLVQDAQDAVKKHNLYPGVDI